MYGYVSEMISSSPQTQGKVSAHGSRLGLHLDSGSIFRLRNKCITAIKAKHVVTHIGGLDWEGGWFDIYFEPFLRI